MEQGTDIALRETLKGLTVLGGDPSAVRVRAITEDSRRAGPGTLFVAVRGEADDGRRFIADALARGAAAVVVTGGADWEGSAAVPIVRVAEGREAVGVLASAIYGRPSAALKLVGVTGTNGKTTTTFLLAEAARAAGLRAGVLGTTGYFWDGGGALGAPNTSPSAAELHRMLGEMRAAGVGLCAAEVSSHAVVQRREAGARFAALAFSNLTQDHLDYHGDLESYFAAKRRLFELHPEAPAAINVDDAYGRRLAGELGDCVRVSVDGAPGAEVRVSEARCAADGIEMRVETQVGRAEIRSPMVGAFNVANLALALGAALCAGLPLEAAAAGLGRARAVPGRMERVSAAGAEVSVFVDYAHTPDALVRALESLRPLTAGRLWVVFGCGGDRDRGKRPLMGEAAARLADRAVVTSDNPRTEPPQAILDHIVAGMGGRAHAVEADRARAIALAVGEAAPGDVVLVAGKGHEDYQIIGAERRPFDDREVARAALAQRAWSGEGSGR